ncbi:hypothetical protein BH10PSE15_BH10PSE15_06340 [soil metagenome]
METTCPDPPGGIAPYHVILAGLVQPEQQLDQHGGKLFVHRFEEANRNIGLGFGKNPDEVGHRPNVRPPHPFGKIAPDPFNPVVGVVGSDRRRDLGMALLTPFRRRRRRRIEWCVLPRRGADRIMADQRLVDRIFAVRVERVVERQQLPDHLMLGRNRFLFA